MLASRLGYVYIDSGAMYRAVTLYLLDAGAININTGHIDAELHLVLNGIDVENRLRDLHVSNWVSEVATVSVVRRKLVEEQRRLGLNKGIVMDGRDIGTVVFPDADLKLFVTASIDVRAHRRRDELLQKNMDYTLGEIERNLVKRDFIDSSRSDSPLLQANDAILL
ncbi:UNVERIFIED_CONTAM: hypothetical protein GTU68_033290, partial [Idotea baltica]|nr:hypothetical protein [Idotea baltica]